MNNISPEVIAVIVVVVIVLFFLPRKKPKEKEFKCARCSKIAPHTNRTIEAWRDGKTKFFCNACHAQWLRTQPNSTGPNYSSRSGCLGVLAILVFVPFILFWR